MTHIQRYLTSEMRDQDLNAVFKLLWHIWPWDNISFEDAYTSFKRDIPVNVRKESDRYRFVIWQGGEVIAHAGVFAREVYTERGNICLGALTGVCVHRDYRGQEFGAQVVRAAFDLVDDGTFPVSLWMTTVPGFYEKLRARIIENTWINSQNQDNPTADPWPHEQKMIYPASYDWPAGQIDLNGSAY